MKLTFTVLLLSLCLLFNVKAQSPYSVKGVVADSISNAHLTNATVSVLNAKDSILRKFVFAKELGAFTIPNLQPGKFILLVSYPDYADYVEMFTLDAAHPAHNFGGINMQLKARLLHDVVIKGTVNAIKIKGDTTEFNAKAYVNQPNDKVEDLLKQLPGIQVDKDGKITANGQAVNKVLVDGEEFFGDDPTLVTKNLRADMVDKVQLYDKKSDQATFTGVDDGQKTKTINIKLKEDKKNGTFGKLTAGIGTHGRYEGQGIYNRFKAKQKYSAYMTSANDGKTGLGFTDNNTLGSGGNNVVFGDDGGIFIFSSANDALDSFDGSYNGRGKPVTHSGGVHYDTKYGAADKYTLNTNYKIGGIDVIGNTETTTQQNLNNASVINTSANQTFDNYSFRQKIDAAYTVKLDTTATLKVTGDATAKNFTVNNTYNTVSQNASGGLINKNNRVVKNDGDQQIINVTAFLTKKFKKVGRTLSWNVSEAYNNNNTKGYLNSEVDYYNQTTGVQNKVDTINQYKTSKVVSSVLNSNVTYSESLSKTTSLLFNYGLGFNNSSSDNRSFNRSAPNVYNRLDPNYTNDYTFNQVTNQLGAILNYKTKKTTLNFGTRATNINYRQVDERTGAAFNRSFINWAPQAFFQYRPSLQESVYIGYNGNTTQPTIAQLQPVLTNADPLNITIGNTNLKPYYSNSINVSYNIAKVLTGFNMYMYAYVSTRYNAIVNNSTTIIDSGKTTTQYLNLSGHTPINYSANFSPSYKIKGLGATLGVGVNTNGNVNYSYINGALNRSKSISYQATANMYKNVEKKYYISLRGGPTYTINEFSLQPDQNNNAFGFNSSGYTSVYLPKNFTISTDATYNYNAATKTFDAQYRTIWNASIGKSFFKDQNLTISVNGYNMLNQNVNFSRSVVANTITQSNTTSIGRYFMLMAVWNFTKFKTGPDKK